jgi:hypothetical protein
MPLRIGVGLAAPPAEPGGWLAEATAYEAAGVDSLWVEGGGLSPEGEEADPWVLLGALAAVTWRVRLGALLVEGPGRPVAAVTLATLARLGRGRLLLGRARPGGTTLDVESGGAVEVWSRGAPPPGRPAWAEALAAAAATGAGGLLVPAAPGLLDLLRNPEAEDDRTDLQLTYG